MGRVPDSLGADFAITMDVSGPDFGWEHFVEQVGVAGRVSIVGERTRLPWRQDTVRIPLVDPVPAYPFLLLHHHQNRHPLLTALIDFVTRDYQPFDPDHQWLPEPDRASFPPG